MSDVDVDRLQRRLERERTARLEAERIAERGMRDLYLANQELDRLVAERTSELDEARRDAEQLGESRAFFLRSLSRQVRAPLNGVLGMLELLEAEIDDTQHGLWLRSASTSARDLLQLVTRLVLFVELEHERPESDSLEIAPVVDRLRAEWTRVSLAHGTLLLVDDHTPPGTSVSAPTGRLEQFLNLAVENAAYFTGASTVRMAFDLEAAGDVDDLQIRIEGDGKIDQELTDGLRLVQSIALLLVEQLDAELTYGATPDSWYLGLSMPSTASIR